MGTAASDWPVLDAVKTSQTNWSKSCFSLIFTGIATIQLILKELCSNPQFKALLNWYQNWKKSHSISLHTKAILAQQLPHDLEEETMQFPQFMIATRWRHDYLLARLYSVVLWCWEKKFLLRHLQSLLMAQNYHLQSVTKRSHCSRFCLSVIPQEGLDGQKRCKRNGYVTIFWRTLTMNPCC